MAQRTESPPGRKWCSKGRHHVMESGFAKGQTTCRVCRQEYGRNNYSKGNRCATCDGVIVNKATYCAPCWGKSRRGTPLKDGRSMTVYGYVMLSGQYDHPNANHRGLVLEHTKVMTEVLGRPLRPGENVHHKNGIRTDNRPENLELWLSSQPSGQRVSDLVEWAREIIDTYGPECKSYNRATHSEPDRTQHRRPA